MQQHKKQWTGWTKQEIELFLTLIPQYKNKYRLYSEHFPNRTYVQIKSQYHNQMRKQNPEKKKE